MRNKRLLLIVVILSIVCDQASGNVEVSTTSDFCQQLGHQLQCDFSNTSENVVVGDVVQGTEVVIVKNATVLHGESPCNGNLEIHSSTNVTLQRPAKPITTNNSVPSSTTYPTKNQTPIVFPSDNNRNSARNTSVRSNSSTSGNRGTSSVSSPSVSIPSSASVAEGEEIECVANISVVHSQVNRLRGNFDLVSLSLTKTVLMEGQFGTLDVSSRSKVLNISVSADNVIIVNTSISQLSRLEVKHQLQLQDVKINSLVPPGIILRGHQDSVGLILPGIRQRESRNLTDKVTQHTLSNVNINFMESEALHLNSGEAVMSNMRINEALPAAITVQDGGTLKISNVHIQQGPLTCITLHGEARIIMDNFTLGKNTISHLEVSSKTSQKTGHPLFAVWSTQEDGTTKTTDNEWKGLSWYWILIMAVVGIVAGIIVGSAMVWRRPGRTPMVLTLADLINWGRRSEENEDHTNNDNSSLEHHLPQLMRQVSGQSCSSFGSFTPRQEQTRPFAANVDGHSQHHHLPQQEDDFLFNKFPSSGQDHTRPFSLRVNQPSITTSTKSLIGASWDPDVCSNVSTLASAHENVVFES